MLIEDHPPNSFPVPSVLRTDILVAVGFRAGIQFYKKQVSLEMVINSTSQNTPPIQTVKKTKDLC